MKMNQTIMIHKKKDEHLYGLLAWLIKATNKDDAFYGLDCLCLEKETANKIRISSTYHGRLHTVVLPTPDCFDLSTLPFNAKKQSVFRVTKKASSIDCSFDDAERSFPNVHSVLNNDINVEICRLWFDGSNADDRSTHLSTSIRKLYQAIDAKLNTIDGPEWNDHGIAIGFLKDLDREEHNWVVYGSNKQTTLRFQYTNGDETKVALFQAMVVHERKSTKKGA